MRTICSTKPRRGGSTYVVINTPISGFVPPTGAPVAFNDDDNQTLNLPNPTPTEGGTISTFEVCSNGFDNDGVVHATWVNVPQFDSNTGTVECNYGAMTSLDGLVGYSPGDGAVIDPTANALGVATGNGVLWTADLN